jgi:hypothetical protein
MPRATTRLENLLRGRRGGCGNTSNAKTNDRLILTLA